MSTTSDHWLTLMNCTLCGQTPDFSPLYKCPLGHAVCSTCFFKLEKKGHLLCSICKKSMIFRKSPVSVHFLKKLKQRPGIGKRKRYDEQTPRLVSSSRSLSNLKDIRNKQITLEDIFQLPAPQIEELFKPNQQKSKIEAKSSPLMCEGFYACPHDGCWVSVTEASFSEHFRRNHSDIPALLAQRGVPLYLIHDVKIVEFSRTLCMAVIKVYDDFDDFEDRVGTFWLMVSGSTKRKKSNSYVLYWVMTSSRKKFNCTLELSSNKDNYRNCVFCPVTKLRDSGSIHDISNQLNCLSLCYSSMYNLLQEGNQLHFRITIH